MIRCLGRRASLPVAAIMVVLALNACSTKPSAKVSSEGMQLCRERQADAAPGTSMEARREGYRACLKTIEAELKQQAAEAKAQRNAEAQQVQQQALDLKSSTASATERYSHCQLVQQQVIEAERMRIRTLGPAMVAARDGGANSPQAEAANANYREAVATLERLIPEPMRAGKPLIPDNIEIYRRCNQEDFKD